MGEILEQKGNDKGLDKNPAFAKEEIKGEKLTVDKHFLFKKTTIIKQVVLQDKSWESMQDFEKKKAMQLSVKVITENQN